MRRTGLLFPTAIAIAPLFMALLGHASENVLLPKGMLLQAELDSSVRFSDVRPGSALRGHFSEPVFAGAQQAFPEGSRIEMEVQSVERPSASHRGRRALSILTNALLSQAGPQPPSYVVHLRSAHCTLPNGAGMSLPLSALALTRAVEIRPKGASPVRARAGRSTMILRLDAPVSLPASEPSARAAVDSSPVDALEQHVKLILLSPLSASRNHEGEPFTAYLYEPIRLRKGDVIPAGSSLEGRIMRRVPPRWLHRAGRLRLSFQKVALSTGVEKEMSGTITGVEPDRRQNLQLDAEGALSGGPASKKRLALELGVSYLVGKVCDDLVEEGIKGAVASATAGSAAATARYVGFGAGALLFALRKGPDLRLPEYTVLELTLGRLPAPALLR